MEWSMIVVVLVKALLACYILLGLWFGLFHWWVVPSVVSIKETAAPKLKETVTTPVPADPSAIECAKVLARREAAHLRYAFSGDDEYAELQASLKARR